MNDDLSNARIWVQVFFAAISAALEYLITASFLITLPVWLEASDELKQYVTFSVAFLVFVMVLYRIRRGTWTREHVSELTEIELDD